MSIVPELIGLSFGIGFKELRKGKQVCFLIIKTEEKLLIEFFEDDDENIYNAHQKATDFLRNMEINNEWYDKATLTYDGYLTVDGEKDEALITQLFSLDSYANKRVSQRYSRGEDEINPIKELFTTEDWEEGEIHARRITKKMYEQMASQE